MWQWSYLQAVLGKALLFQAYVLPRSTALLVVQQVPHHHSACGVMFVCYGPTQRNRCTQCERGLQPEVCLPETQAAPLTRAKQVVTNTPTLNAIAAQHVSYVVRCCLALTHLLAESVSCALQKGVESCGVSLCCE